MFPILISIAMRVIPNDVASCVNDTLFSCGESIAFHNSVEIDKKDELTHSK
jgi:hypothetical protein